MSDVCVHCQSALVYAGHHPDPARPWLGMICYMRCPWCDIMFSHLTSEQEAMVRERDLAADRAATEEEARMRQRYRDENDLPYVTQVRNGTLWTSLSWDSVPGVNAQARAQYVNAHGPGTYHFRVIHTAPTGSQTVVEEQEVVL